jgi:uncharacterized membrane protein YfcA
MLLYANYSGAVILNVGSVILCITVIASAISLYRASSGGKNLMKHFFIALFVAIFYTWGFISLSVVPDGLNTLAAFFALLLLGSIMGVIIVKRKKEKKMLLGLGYVLCWTTILTVIISFITMLIKVS